MKLVVVAGFWAGALRYEGTRPTLFTRGAWHNPHRLPGTLTSPSVLAIFNLGIKVGPFLLHSASIFRLLLNHAFPAFNSKSPIVNCIPTKANHPVLKSSLQSSFSSSLYIHHGKRLRESHKSTLMESIYVQQITRPSAKARRSIPLLLQSRLSWTP